MVQKIKPKILLIEDDQPTIELYQDAFKFYLKTKIEVIRWGEKALEELKRIREGKRKKPDLILLDLILPDINGILILEEVRKYPETKDLLIFALTNYTDHELDQELIKEGIDKILVKTTYTPKKLIEIIKEVLKLK